MIGFPYTITKAEWDDYYKVQQSARINMMAHPNVQLFFPKGSWQKAFDHFETNQRTEDLVMLNAD